MSPSLPSRYNFTDSDWAVPSKCLWDAPARMSGAVSLKLIWEPVGAALGLQDRDNLEQFFRHTLLIGDITAGGILEELADLSKCSQDNPAHSLEMELVHQLYQRLDGMRKGMDESNSKVIKYVSFLFVVAYIFSPPNPAATNILSGRNLNINSSSMPHRISLSGGSNPPNAFGQVKAPYLAKFVWNPFTRTSLSCSSTISVSQS